jgi:hypothetical protein
MRNIKQLLELMLEHQDLFIVGLCGWVNTMESNEIITYEEYKTLERYIDTNRPRRNLFNFYKVNSRRVVHYWERGILIYRLAWIKKHIKKNSKTNL